MLLNQQLAIGSGPDFINWRKTVQLLHGGTPLWAFVVVRAGGRAAVWPGRARHTQTHTTRCCVGVCRAGVQLSKVEVRFNNLEVSADVNIGSRGMPTVANAFINTPLVSRQRPHAETETELCVLSFRLCAVRLCRGFAEERHVVVRTAFARAHPMLGVSSPRLIPRQTAARPA